jgi:N-acetylglucosaminyldiphosphoundecaprenol N-acetyl-beta-D-mannosaminyltransferase
MEKLRLNSISFRKLKNLMLDGLFSKKIIFNFLNSHSAYHYLKTREYYERVKEKYNFNLIDGFVLSVLSHGKRLQGPEFSRKLLEDSQLTRDRFHFFVGFEEEDLDLLEKEFPTLRKENMECYNPPFISGTYEFSKKEVEKIKKLINKKKRDYVWVGVGSPKQEILANDLYKGTKTRFFFCVGAAFDFLTKKKKEAPKIIRNLGIEWLYRLINDFNHSSKKAWHSLIGTFLITGKIKPRDF